MDFIGTSSLQIFKNGDKSPRMASEGTFFIIPSNMMLGPCIAWCLKSPFSILKTLGASHAIRA